MPSEVWDKNTHAFPSFNGCTDAVCEWILGNFNPHFVEQVERCHHLSVLGLKLIHVFQRGPRWRYRLFHNLFAQPQRKIIFCKAVQRDYTSEFRINILIPLVVFLCNVAWWRHQMEPFSALLAICAGIHRSPLNSPHKGQWRRALVFSLICVWINNWVNSGEDGDLRRYRAHYDVTVMTISHCSCNYPHSILRSSNHAIVDTIWLEIKAHIPHWQSRNHL